MTVRWITPKGSLGIVTERIILEIPLQATSDTGTVEYSLLAGNLPRGLRLVGNIIKGSPTEVRKFTESRFVIRANDGTDIEDRTFSISVDGSDEPEWITKEGFLNIGQGENYFVLDNAYVDFRLEATDTDETIGDVLEYYLIPNGGQLPPGLTLSRQGRISGFTDPVFSIEYQKNLSGAYDTGAYDILPLDRAEVRSNGYDTFFYDNVTYDYNEPTQVPRRLSRFYTFVVGVTDGLNEIRRLFRIWVVTEEFLQADNNLVQVDTNLFRADNTGDRVPIWITESFLGRLRANNYITIFLDVYDPPSLSGTITYFLVTNPGTYRHKETGEIIYDGRYEISGFFPNFERSKPILGVSSFKDPDDWEVLIPETNSALPPGLVLDSVTGELAGRVPYQAAITKNYQFTIRAIDFPISLPENNLSFKGVWTSSVSYYRNDTIIYNNLLFICIQPHKNQPPINNPLYWESATAYSDKTFNVDLIGEIESKIEWISDSFVGSIKPNQPSRLFVEAKSLMYGGRVSYELVSGTLPPGLSLISTGNIQGKVKQFADADSLGLTRFYEKTDSEGPNSSTGDSSTIYKEFSGTFDGSTTSFDKIFKFKIKAKDAANFAESIKEFSIQVIADNVKTYANLYLKAFQTKDKRLQWSGFITDGNIFRPEEIYRYGDINYGVQNEIKMLLFAGIESVQAVEYVQAMSRNHYRKRIRFGDVKSAQGKDQESQEVLYEVVYVEVIDEYEKNGKSISKTINLSDNIESKVLVSYDAIKIDSDIPLVSDSDHQRIFPNSIKNMRSRIKNIGERDREFLPLWMRSIQSNNFVESGYVKVIPLCYVKPGFSEPMISRIKLSGFDFKTIDFEADRYLIDVLDGEIENKYLAFPQRGEKLP